ncbi:MAG: hypothetical protein V1796_02460, partial [Pseudomonadota bacterium]
AWCSRMARNEELADLLRGSMGIIGDRVKKRLGVDSAEVDRVIECLKADRCGCDRCRYGV